MAAVTVGRVEIHGFDRVGAEPVISPSTSTLLAASGWRYMGLLILARLVLIRCQANRARRYEQ